MTSFGLATPRLAPAHPCGISLLLREEDPLTVSRLVGHARASMSLDVYGHVLVDEAEIDYAEALA